MIGKYRGATHEDYNVNYKNPSSLPVYRHILAGCYVYLFTNDEQKNISFSKEVKIELKLRFLDTFKFTASHTDTLFSKLKKEQLRETSKHYSNDLLDLRIKKGVYPYEYMDIILKTV